MRVAILNQHMDYVFGGSELQCDLIGRGLTQLGHDVLYISPQSTFISEIRSDYKTIQIERSADKIIDSIININPDVVYWRYNKNFLFRVARKINKLGIPIVFAASAIDDVTITPGHVQDGWKGKILACLRLLKSAWEHQGLRHVDHVIVLNADLLGRVKRVPQTHILDAVTNEVSPFSWPRNYCAWIANIKPQKRPEEFVRLARSLEPLGIDCIMVGHLQSASYSWLSKREAVPSNFYYLGPRTIEEVNGILAGSLFHVHTCSPEGFGNVFIQAWLQGRPSISLGFDPSGYLKQHDIGCDAQDDWDAFVQVAHKLAIDSAAREAMGARAQHFAHQTFSIEGTVTQVENVLKTVFHSKFKHP